MTGYSGTPSRIPKYRNNKLIGFYPIPGKVYGESKREKCPHNREEYNELCKWWGNTCEECYKRDKEWGEGGIYMTIDDYMVGYPAIRQSSEELNREILSKYPGEEKNDD